MTTVSLDPTVALHTNTSKKNHTKVVHGKAPPVYVSETQLAEIMGVQGVSTAQTQACAHKYVGPLNATLHAYGITTRLRICAFLGNVAEESAYLTGMAQSGDYDSKSYDVGRGALQLTGVDNYVAYFTAINEKDPSTTDPRVVWQKPSLAFDSAGWYWAKNGIPLNQTADNLDPTATKPHQDPNFLQIVAFVNGGPSATRPVPGAHTDQRFTYYKRALHVLFPDNDGSPHAPAKPVAAKPK